MCMNISSLNGNKIELPIRASNKVNQIAEQLHSTLLTELSKNGLKNHYDSTVNDDSVICETIEIETAFTISNANAGCKSAAVCTSKACDKLAKINIDVFVIAIHASLNSCYTLKGDDEYVPKILNKRFPVGNSNLDDITKALNDAHVWVKSQKDKLCCLK